MKQPSKPRRPSARLGADLVATKGKAVKPSEAPQRGASAPASDRWASAERIRVTVRLLPDDYRRLHLYAFERRLSHQEILETAVMEYLDRREGKGGAG